ncbi:hypothetical protein GT037_000131 [Alternaria burnsii]|uniref:Uncharacterized protein n=1 Tax=Alternaria burnsii TaxID=1187904 RepID=A0A8H7BBC2_9PLEO|nr:uncharacterized protein GT037_000131 [Alternaria burnsii]KAF7681155.1 hypothetical protein GT037_000131 [Alternaria burnsii]
MRALNPSRAHKAAPSRTAWSTLVIRLTPPAQTHQHQHEAMQSSAGKRVLSTLASKIHPQLPLSPRESQQLLNLLTNSFRTHLDHAHPLAPSESSQRKPTRELTTSHGRRNSSPNRQTSSYDSATQHIDSILNNPLLAVKPRRRGSGPAAIDIMRDPMAWFIDEIATGSATLPKAAVCLEYLEKTTNPSPLRLENGRSPATVLAEWLKTSNLENSKQLLEMSIKSGRGTRFLNRLVALLLAEGETTALWRWFIRSNEQRAKDTGLDVARIATFKQQLLAKMVVLSADNKDVISSMNFFMQAFRLLENAGYEAAYDVLRPAGGHLVNLIISNPDHSIAPLLYQKFLLSSTHWCGDWSRAVQSMLSLHHPTQPSAKPGLIFIRDSAGAITYVNASPGRRNFLVKLCLGVARQLMEEENFAEAQSVMEFTKEHFPDMVLRKQAIVQQQTAEEKIERRERRNLELLDRLVLT